MRTPRGRVATPAAWAHLGLAAPPATPTRRLASSGSPTRTLRGDRSRRCRSTSTARPGRAWASRSSSRWSTARPASWPAPPPRSWPMLGEGHPDGEHPKAKHELFECTIEIITGVCTTVAEARADLEATLAEVPRGDRRAGAWSCCARAPTRSPTGHDQDGQPEPALRPARSRRCSGWPSGCRSSASTCTSASARPRRRWPSPTPWPATSRTSWRCRRRAPTGRATTPGWPRAAARCSRACPPPACPHQLDGLGRVRAVHGHARLRRGDQHDPRGVVGHPAPPRTSAPSSCGCATACRRWREVAAVAAIGQCLVDWLDHLIDRGYTLPRHRGLGPAPEQVAGRPLRARRRADHRRRRAALQPLPGGGRGAASTSCAGGAAGSAASDELRTASTASSGRRVQLHPPAPRLLPRSAGDLRRGRRPPRRGAAHRRPDEPSRP